MGWTRWTELQTLRVHAIKWQISNRYMMVEAFAQINKEKIDPILSITTKGCLIMVSGHLGIYTGLTGATYAHHTVHTAPASSSTSR